MKNKFLAATLGALLLCQSVMAQSDTLSQMQSLVNSLESKPIAQQTAQSQSTQASPQPQAQPTPSAQSIIEQRLETPLSINTATSPMTFESLVNYISNAIRIPIILKNFYASTTGGTTPVAGGAPMPMPAMAGGTQSGMQAGITQIGYVTFYANNEPARYVLDQLCGIRFVLESCRQYNCYLQI